MKMKLWIDKNSQWFVDAWIFMNGRTAPVKFKVDTGCNALVLSHSTLNLLGYSTKVTDLSKLPKVTGKLASGDDHTFRQVGKIVLSKDDKQKLQLCNATAICHTTKETHDLLGTEVLQQFDDVFFSVKDRQLLLR